MIIYNSIFRGGPTFSIIVSALIGGTIAGLLFAWIMQYTAKRLVKNIIIETADNETILKEGFAARVASRMAKTNTPFFDVRAALLEGRK